MSFVYLTKCYIIIEELKKRGFVSSIFFQNTNPHLNNSFKYCWVLHKTLPLLKIWDIETHSPKQTNGQKQHKIHRFIFKSYSFWSICPNSVSYLTALECKNKKGRKLKIVYTINQLTIIYYNCKSCLFFLLRTLITMNKSKNQSHNF